MAELTLPALGVVQKAKELADAMGHPFAGTEHVLLAIVQSDDDAAAHRILSTTGALEAVERYLDDVFFKSG